MRNAHATMAKASLIRVFFPAVALNFILIQSHMSFLNTLLLLILFTTFSSAIVWELLTARRELQIRKNVNICSGNCVEIRQIIRDCGKF